MIRTIGQTLKKLREDKHWSQQKENIQADEKLLEGIRMSNDKIYFQAQKINSELNTQEIAINVLNREHLKIKTDIEKLKHAANMS